MSEGLEFAPTWKEPVETFGDLPADAEENDGRLITGNNHVAVFKDGDWEDQGKMFTMSGSYHIERREHLLGQMHEELRTRLQRAEQKKQGFSVLGPTTTDVAYIKVSFCTEEGEVLMWTYFAEALQYLVEDLYWSEDGDWSDAHHLAFD